MDADEIVIVDCDTERPALIDRLVPNQLAHKSSRTSNKRVVNEHQTCVTSPRVLRRHVPRSVTFSDLLRMQDWLSWTRAQRKLLDLGGSESHASRKGRNRRGCRTSNDVQTGRWNDDVSVLSPHGGFSTHVIVSSAVPMLSIKDSERCKQRSTSPRSRWHEAFAVDRRPCDEPEGTFVMGPFRCKNW